jgi:alanine dehydrogenase
VPKSASQALSAALLPYALRIARPDWRQQPDLQRGINVAGGAIIHPSLRQYVA